MFFRKKYFIISLLFTEHNKRKENVSLFYAFDFCCVELRKFIRQTSCTHLMKFYFLRISTWFSTEGMDLKNVNLRGSAFKVFIVKHLERSCDYSFVNRAF